jgi:ankyrin repeat protein
MIPKLLTMGLLAILPCGTQETKPLEHPAFDYQVARMHEIGTHRRSIPIKGAQGGFNQLTIKLVVSATGEVVTAEASGDERTMKFWPEIQGEIEQWRFTPFEKNGKAMVAEVEEYVDLVPEERLPKLHVKAPEVKPDSNVKITLERTGCLGMCPGYKVAVATDGIVFEGNYYVVATGRHTDRVDPDAVRTLAKRFVAADFYSMDKEYIAGVTDNPSYVLSIEIDGKSKIVVDYVGQWEGMPAIVVELEDAVDKLAGTERWIKGADGLVELLKAEKYNFATYDAQLMLKSAAQGGQSETVNELLAAGVPLKPLPAPKRKTEYEGIPFEHVGWLNAASGNPETLKVLIDAGASKNDQDDKDLALAGAARSGMVLGVKALLAYGANPNADLSKLTMTESGGGMTIQAPGAGSILIDAAQSGNPEMVQEILKYHPKLEAKDREGKTAMFAAGEYRSSDADGARVECVRLLARAGAKVNARDNEKNTPLHETFLLDVQEELLKLGADVNARNEDGETPIFTVVDDDAIRLFLEHGADLTIRNKDGKTVMEAAESKGPLRQEALRDAIFLHNGK